MTSIVDETIDRPQTRAGVSVAASLVCLLAAGGCAGRGVVPAAEGIVIYSATKYRGNSQVLTADVKNLFRWSPNRDEPGGCIDGGSEGALGPDYRYSWARCISSVRIQTRVGATLYQHDSFKGQSLTITDSVPDLAKVPGPCRGTFKACVNSIQVSKVQ